MNGKSKGLAGIAAAMVVVTIAALVAVPVLVASVVSGLFVAVGGVAAGALGNEQIEEDESGGDGQCIVDGAGAVTASQSEYVKSIVGVAKDLGVSKDGQIVAVMVALQESGIQNYANDGGNHFGYDIGTSQGTKFWLDAVKYSMKLPHDAVGKDADSVGLFQQRPSSGWADTPGFKASDDTKAAVNRLMNPEFSARAFFGGPDSPGDNRGLLDVSGWESMDPTVAAQTVQGSAFPSAYAKWESQATSLVNANSSAPAVSADEDSDSDDAGSGDSASSDSSSPSPSASEANEDSSGFVMPMKEGDYEITSQFGTRDSPGGVGSSDHKGLDFGAPVGTAIQAPADGTVMAAGSAEGFGQWVVLDHEVDGSKYSTVYGHVTPSSIKVKKGDKVNKGDQIAGIGNEGTSTGPHLHWEVWDGGRFSGGTAVDPEEVVSGDYSGSDGADGGGGAGCGTAEAENAGAEASGDVKDIIEAGEKQEGVDYSWGGGSKDGPGQGFGPGAGVNGFDCSSLMQYMIYQGTNEGYELPRTAAEQYEATKGNQVAKAGDDEEKLKPGDLLFWGDSASSINHVAMYVGDGQMIEAPRTGLKVRTTEVRLNDSYFGATRVDYSKKG